MRGSCTSVDSLAAPMNPPSVDPTRRGGSTGAGARPGFPSKFFRRDPNPLLVVPFAPGHVSGAKNSAVDEDDFGPTERKIFFDFTNFGDEASSRSPKLCVRKNFGECCAESGGPSGGTRCCPLAAAGGSGSPRRNCCSSKLPARRAALFRRADKLDPKLVDAVGAAGLKPLVGLDGRIDILLI
uniref:Uncharacterized protein n=1 Tax=Anopheles atroparvus TaxID=41427 RepID=A0A182IL20_ANOAO